MYAQVLCERLGIEADAVRFVSGDTDRVAFGLGAGGSRCSALGTAALLMAADRIIDKGRTIAADMLETAEADVAFEDRRYAVAGTDRSVPFLDVVRRAFMPGALADGIEPGMYQSATYKASVASYPNGCHVCEVEIDPETGVVEIVRYVVVDDFGTVLNPALVEGQVHGGVAQGAGQILMEQVRYDPESGQMLTGSLMDYAMPRADDLPMFEVESNPVPTATNPLGVKGAGEAGTVGALPAVMNGIIDALKPHGIRHLDMPASPERIWRAIRAAGTAR
jgi:carbon-monoxide dehydrogenase large subunit